MAAFLEFREATGHRGKMANRPDCPPDRPAWVDLDSALRFAQWVGGRFPFSTEVLRAQASGALVLEQDEDIGGEYVLDVGDQRLTTHAWLSYGSLREKPEEALGLAVNAHEPIFVGADGSAHVIFRVVFSCDHPDTYRELSTAPFDENAPGIRAGQDPQRK